MRVVFLHFVQNVADRMQEIADKAQMVDVIFFMCYKRTIRDKNVYILIKKKEFRKRSSHLRSVLKQVNPFFIYKKGEHIMAKTKTFKTIINLPGKCGNSDHNSGCRPLHHAHALEARGECRSETTKGAAGLYDRQLPVRTYHDGLGAC